MNTEQFIQSIIDMPLYKKDNTKKGLTISLDKEVIDFVKSKGSSSRYINNLLKLIKDFEEKKE